MKRRKIYLIIIISVLLLVLAMLMVYWYRKSEDKKVRVIEEKITPPYSEEELNFLNNLSCEKPIIYLYPNKEENVEVILGYKEKLTCVYPEYKSSWKVIAKPNGDLVDINTGRNLYALYYESKVDKLEVKDEGFVVKGEDTVSFLEEELKILGLNERESQEFIIYWLPKLQNSKYNYIHFATLDEINNIMPINVFPKPDTIIRILMEYKPIEQKIEVREQELITPNRSGFTLVEWGGSKIE